MAFTDIEILKRHLRMEGCSLDEGEHALLVQYLEAAEMQVSELIQRPAEDVKDDPRFTQAVLMQAAAYHDGREAETNLQLHRSPAFQILINRLKRHVPGKL